MYKSHHLFAAGPNFKRGPPKGYIQALEHRLQLVETVLSAIITSDEPSSKSIVNSLSKDSVARNVMEFVHYGPFGPANASHSNGDEQAFDSLYGAPVNKQASNRLHNRSGRGNRESRIERELMSQNQGLSSIIHFLLITNNTCPLSDEIEVPSHWKLTLLTHLSQPDDDARYLSS